MKDTSKSQWNGKLAYNRVNQQNLKVAVWKKMNKSITHNTIIFSKEKNQVRSIRNEKGSAITDFLDIRKM